MSGERSGSPPSIHPPRTPSSVDGERDSELAALEPIQATGSKQCMVVASIDCNPVKRDFGLCRHPAPCWSLSWPFPPRRSRHSSVLPLSDLTHFAHVHASVYHSSMLHTAAFFLTRMCTVIFHASLVYSTPILQWLQAVPHMPLFFFSECFRDFSPFFCYFLCVSFFHFFSPPSLLLVCFHSRSWCRVWYGQVRCWYLLHGCDES